MFCVVLVPGCGTGPVVQSVIPVTGVAPGYLSVDHIEEQVADLYHRTRRPEALIDAVRDQVRVQFDQQNNDLNRQARKQRGKKKALQDSLQQLRDAYLEGLFTIEEFKEQQTRLRRQLDALEAALTTGKVRHEDISTTLERCLDLAAHCDKIYQEGTPAVRRLLNQAIFTKILVDKDNPSQGEPTGPYASLLNPDFQEDVKDHAKNPATPSALRGSNLDYLAPPTGFEPVLPP